MKTLGLNISGYLSSAAIVENAIILAASCEERYSRQKRDRGFPAQAIRQALKQAALDVRDLDAVAVSWNPAHNLGRNWNLQGEANRVRAKYLAYVPNALAGLAGLAPSPTSAQQINGLNVVYVDHHLAHAASACYTSPFRRSAVVTIDAFGEDDSMVIGRFVDGRIELLEHTRYPHSVGSWYSYFTEFLGFQADSDEYKVMALGAYAKDDDVQRFKDRVRATFRVSDEHGKPCLELDLSLFDFYLFHRPRDFGPLERHLGMAPRNPADELLPVHFGLARAMQECYEEMVGAVMRRASTLTGEENVCLAGGCFMNSLANGKLALAARPFSGLHIPPYPDDSGGAIGAALYQNLNAKGRAHKVQRHNFFGPSEDSAQALSLVLSRKLGGRQVAKPARKIAELLAEGQIVGHVHGAMEFGQRALGNRSIFADASDPKVKDNVNATVKYREWFRPYAASILADQVHMVFDVPVGFRSDFMEKVCPVRPEWRERIAGLLHADGTVRVQTVERSTCPRLHGILTWFHRLTGIPLVLNTSFNMAGEPMVCTFVDAVRTFYSSGLDSLFLDDVWLQKPGASPFADGYEARLDPGWWDR
jgi:carbamoyltransferase